MQINHVFSLNVAPVEIAAVPGCDWLLCLYLWLYQAWFLSVCGTIGFQDLRIYQHRWVSLLLKMNTEKEKERTVTGENEDITVNTLYQQLIAQKKDKEVCMKLNS